MQYQRFLCRRDVRRGEDNNATKDVPTQYSTIEISVWQEKSATEEFTLGLGLLGGKYGFGGIRREGIGGRGGWAVEGKVLGFVVPDGAEEGVVVGGALGGDLPEEKIDVARGGDGRAFRGVVRGESGDHHRLAPHQFSLQASLRR